MDSALFLPLAFPPLLQVWWSQGELVAQVQGIYKMRDSSFWKFASEGGREAEQKASSTFFFLLLLSSLMGPSRAVPVVFFLSFFTFLCVRSGENSAQTHHLCSSGEAEEGGLWPQKHGIRQKVKQKCFNLRKNEPTIFPKVYVLRNRRISTKKEGKIGLMATAEKKEEEEEK